jgi:hypothetical protein
MALPLNPEQQQFDAYMANVLRIVNNEIRNALRTQGLGTVNDFVALTENDIEDVCKIIGDQEELYLIQHSEVDKQVEANLQLSRILDYK